MSTDSAATKGSFPSTSLSWIDEQLGAGESGRAALNRHLMLVYSTPLERYLGRSRYRVLGDAADLVAEVDAARIDQNCELLGRLSRDPQRVRDLSLLLYVATIGSQVVLTGKKGDEDNIRRIEDRVARAIMGQSDEP